MVKDKKEIHTALQNFEENDKNMNKNYMGDKVLDLIVNAISSLKSNGHNNEDDLLFLKSLEKEIHLYDFIKYNSQEYKRLEAHYEEFEYPDGKLSFEDARYLLITELKKIVETYKIKNKIGFDQQPSLDATTALQTQIDVLKSTQNGLLNIYNENYSNNKADLEALQNELTIANGKVAELSQKYEEVSKQDSLKTRKEIAKLSREIKKKHKQIEGFVADASVLAEGKKYEDYAKDNKTSARCLFWISIFVMAVVAVIMTHHFWNITESDIKYFWIRASLSFIILLPAFFLMRESKKLKDKEFQYYDMATRIKTSAPYIDGLKMEEKERDALKANLVKEFFGRPIECKDDGGLPPVDQICEVIKTCLEKR